MMAGSIGYKFIWFSSFISGVSLAILCCCVCPCLTSWKGVLFWIPVERETWEERLFPLNMHRGRSN
jgi:hypothetical protein